MIVIAADIVLVAMVPGPWVVVMLALGNTIGVTVAGIALLIAVRRARGTAALAGAGRAGPSGLAAALAGAGAGAGVAAALHVSGPVAAGLAAVLAAVCALGVFVVVAGHVLDGGELRAAMLTIRRVLVR